MEPEKDFGNKNTVLKKRNIATKNKEQVEIQSRSGPMRTMSFCAIDDVFRQHLEAKQTLFRPNYCSEAGD
jgi:hypothetical protein